MLLPNHQGADRDKNVSKRRLFIIQSSDCDLLSPPFWPKLSFEVLGCFGRKSRSGSQGGRRELPGREGTAAQPPGARSAPGAGRHATSPPHRARVREPGAAPSRCHCRGPRRSDLLAGCSEHPRERPAAGPPLSPRPQRERVIPQTLSSSDKRRVSPLRLPEVALKQMRLEGCVFTSEPEARGQAGCTHLRALPGVGPGPSRTEQDLHGFSPLLPRRACVSQPASLRGVLWKPVSPHGTHSRFSGKKAVATETGKPRERKLKEFLLSRAFSVLCPVQFRRGLGFPTCI